MNITLIAVSQPFQVASALKAQLNITNLESKFVATLGLEDLKKLQADVNRLLFDAVSEIKDPEARVRHLIGNGKHIEAIKVIREHTSVGLYAAKRAADAYRDKGIFSDQSILDYARKLETEQPRFHEPPRTNRVGVHVFHNHTLSFAPDAPQAGDQLEYVLALEMHHLKGDDRSVLDRVFAGLNDGSGKEFTEFKGRSLRSLRTGDIVTLAFGDVLKNPRIVSYASTARGWRQLPEAVRHPGTWKG